MNTGSIVLVTGANRGLGKEVCRQLAERDCRVILTARSLDAARQAASELDCGVIAAQLDVTDPDSIQALVKKVQQEHGHLDVLINNAAIHYDTWQNAVNADLSVVQEAMDTNLYGSWRMIQQFLPLIQNSQHPRIVNVSSGAGAMRSMGGSTPAYSLSKVGLNALTLMMANQLKDKGVLVNAVCPGWVATDMGGAGGRPIPEGAAGIVWAALLPDNGPTGGFFRDKQAIDW
ncbi:SDR family oxidoreductase [Parendozoicomonas haliclonae]|uniref:3-oxoacyl-[acyl-carrier-protein] reductase FabG n=1 Tax=Parendozoicomonas haliclonae TaxID=1960125 RepID=A0A1X7ARI6_9GAMM|nr:SDR family oxidoreductase [Parendozoicomonas haliclonae]SMA50709.1 3-oxoacyl-[acyl-carrier-protein] reductase FabG [Parendozoicomonas haliclonae]